MSTENPRFVIPAYVKYPPDYSISRVSINWVEIPLMFDMKDVVYLDGKRELGFPLEKVESAFLPLERHIGELIRRGDAVTLYCDRQSWSDPIRDKLSPIAIKTKHGHILVNNTRRLPSDKEFLDFVASSF
jgi:hypothetical protein